MISCYQGPCPEQALPRLRLNAPSPLRRNRLKADSANRTLGGSGRASTRSARENEGYPDLTSRRRHRPLDHTADARLDAAQCGAAAAAGGTGGSAEGGCEGAECLRAGCGGGWLGQGRAPEAFQWGVQVLRQYIAREGKTTVGRQHVEELPDGTSVRLGVFLSNHKSRRDRLSED